MWIINNIDKISQIPCYEREFYFVNIIEHLSININSRQKDHQTEDIERCKDIALDYSVDERADDNILTSEIEQALEELSDRDFSLMYMFVFKQMKPKEINEAMKIPHDNIHVYILLL